MFDLGKGLSMYICRYLYSSGLYYLFFVCALKGFYIKITRMVSTYVRFKDIKQMEAISF